MPTIVPCAVQVKPVPPSYRFHAAPMELCRLASLSDAGFRAASVIIGAARHRQGGTTTAISNRQLCLECGWFRTDATGQAVVDENKCLRVLRELEAAGVVCRVMRQVRQTSGPG